MKLLRVSANSILFLATLFQGFPLQAKEAPLVEFAGPQLRKLGGHLKVGDPSTGVHYEVIGLEADDSHQSDKIVEQLRDELRTAIRLHPNDRFEVNIRMGHASTNTSNDTKLDYEAYAFGDQIASVDRKRVQLSHDNIPRDPQVRQSFAYKRFYQKKYRMTFALVRGAVNWGVTTWSLNVSPQIPWEVSMGIGALTGAMSFSIMYWSKPFYNWATDTWLFGTLFTRYRDPYRAPKALQRVEEYSRWYVTEIAYVLIVKAAMSALDADADFSSVDTAMQALRNVFWTSIYATVAQGSWDLAITNTRKRAERTKLLSQNQIDFRADLKYLAISTAAISLLIARLMHPTAVNADFSTIDKAYAAMAILGTGAYLRSFWLDRKERRFEATAQTRRTKINCNIMIKRMAPPG